MEDKVLTENKPDVPYIVYEAETARAERHIKRLWIALIVSVCVTLAVVGCFLWYISLFDYESYEVVAEGDGHANYIGQDGDINNNGGESLSS